LIKKAYKLGEFNNINVALIIYKYSQYTTYRSMDYISWPLSIAEIISKIITCVKYIASINTYISNCLFSLKEYIIKRYREAPF
jgi:hypothetical protein